MQQDEDLLQRVINGLNAKRVGKGWIAKCPAHDDRNPSLSIGVGRNQKILLYCFTGCEWSAIVTELKKLGLWN